MPSMTLKGQLGEDHLFYEVRGEGQPLVFIHAEFADMHMWDAQFEYFAATHQVIRYDKRGSGQSEACGLEKIMESEDLHRLLNHLGLDKPILIGCSSGAVTALDFAFVFPERVGGLVLVGYPFLPFPHFQPKATPTPQEKIAEFQAMQGRYDEAVELDLQILIDGQGRPPEEIPYAIRDYVAPHYRQFLHNVWRRNLGFMVVGSDQRRLDCVQAPALIVVGSLDTEQAHEMADFLVKGLSDARKVVIPDTARLVNMEVPETFNALVQAFLESET